MKSEQQTIWIHYDYYIIHLFNTIIIKYQHILHRTNIYKYFYINERVSSNP